jgi:hypothetical protein
MKRVLVRDLCEGLILLAFAVGFPMLLSGLLGR